MKRIKLYCANLLNRFLLWKQRRYYHNSVETLSIGAWWKVQDNTDFIHLVKPTILSNLYFYFIPKRKDVSLKSSEIWDTVFDSYIKLIGLQKEFLHLNKCKVQLKDLMCDMIITGNAFIQNHIVVKEAEINRILAGFKSVSAASNEDSVIVIEENRRMPIDIYSMTVVKYYSLVKYYTAKRKKEVSQMKSAA